MLTTWTPPASPSISREPLDLAPRAPWRSRARSLPEETVCSRSTSSVCSAAATVTLLPRLAFKKCEHADPGCVDGVTVAAVEVDRPQTVSTGNVGHDRATT